MTRPTLTAVACATLIVGTLVAPPFWLQPAVACVVGNGTCTEPTLDACLPGGGSFDGTVTFNCGGAATITITNTKTISADTVIDGGGLITISGGNSVGVFSVTTGVKFTVQNLTVANGVAGNGGGGIWSAGTLMVTNSTFSGNGGNGNANGGGIFNNGGTLTVTGSTFSGNSAFIGGGIYTNGGTLTVSSSTFSGNGAVSGGGIYTNGGTLTVSSSTFSGNGASVGSGGGIFNYGGTLTVTDSTFSGNSVIYGGGGIYNGSGTLTVTNSTFSGNSAGGGGGIDNNGGTLTVTDSTFSDNSAGGSGGIYNYGGTATVTNTILTNSTSGGNCAGIVTDGGHNIDDGATCGFTGTGCTSTSGSSFCNTDPILDPTGLQDNGGPTQTVALCTDTGAPNAGCTGTSPAINAGDEGVCSTTTGTAPVDNLDQRGFVRPGAGATNCSIGAYEANASGAPCVVGTGTGASCTESALDACLPGGGSFDGTVTFNCGGAATITITSTKIISADTTIDGGGLVTISGGNSVGVFLVYGFVSFTVENLVVANGNSESGGGIAGRGTVTVTNSTFSGNSAGGGEGGGGIANFGTLTVTNSTFSGNGASGGGGGAISTSEGRVTVTNSTFSGNSAGGGDGGGAIYTLDATLTVTNSTFSDNSAGTAGGFGGGAISNEDGYSGGTVTVTNSTFSGNSAGDGGGGIANLGTLTVANSTFSNNSAGTAGGFGGGIANFGTLTVANSTFSGNVASTGGGISNSYGTLTVTNSTFSGNSAIGDFSAGGAIANQNSTATVTNSTFSGNSADFGGGIYNNGIYNNGIYTPGILTVTNTILANSPSGGNCYSDTIDGSVITDGDHNIDDGTTCGFTGTGCASTSGSSFCGTNPILDTTGLQDTGGPTQTIALCTGAGAPSAGCTGASPAINAGDESVCSTTTGTAPVDNLDQRGFVRPGAGATNCSIGAYEANASGVATCTAAATYDAAADFEQGWTTQRNPNGVWSYGYSSGFADPITLYDQTVQNGVNGPNAQYWLSPSVDIGTSPAAELNYGPAYDNGNVDFLADQLVLVAGIGGQYSELIFTAPADGMYSIASSFRGDQYGIGTVVGVVANGTVLFSSSVTAEGQTVPFGTEVSLAAGNTVVFSVGPGGGGQNTGLSVTITGCPRVAVVGNGTAASCTDAALNTALSGGGLVTFNCGPGAVTIDISAAGGGTGTKTISADTTIDGGGLITISGGSSVGVFSVNPGVNFTVQNLTVANGNSTSADGGGIYNNSGTVTVANSTFASNSTSAYGGGIYNNSGTVTVTNSTFASNSASAYGGGIYNYYGTVTVTNSSFSGNSTYGGGGISSNRGTLTVTNSTFSGNSAVYGGGIGSTAILTVTNSTFSSNSGGGISNSGPLTVTNSTFSGNSASYAGSGIVNAGGTVTVANTILANSPSASNCSGTITDGGHNIDDNGSCGFSGTSLSNTNPMLDPAGLANNGGPTQTIALQAGSPAINAGDESVCSTTTGTAPVDNLDQRGFVRPGTGAANCSIGAFEANLVTPTVTPPPSPSNTSTATPTATPTYTPTPIQRPTQTNTPSPLPTSRTKGTTTEMCLTGTAPDVANDPGQIKAARALVERACVCSSFDGTRGNTHKDYVKCATDILTAQINAAALRSKCKATVTKYYSNSTCGMNPNLHTEPCVQTSVKTGKMTCAVKATTKKDGVTPTNSCTDTIKTTRVDCTTSTLCIDCLSLINGPPSFPGITLVAPTDEHDLMLAWLPASDATTLPDAIVYQVHVSTQAGFTPSAATLAVSLVGETETTISNLDSGMTYYVLVLAVDHAGNVSTARDYRNVTMPAFPVVASSTRHARAADLNLGAPTAMTGSSLTFKKTRTATAPAVGSILAGLTAEGGYLRTVESSNVTTSEIDVQTGPASVGDAFDQMSISSDVLLFDVAAAASQPTAATANARAVTLQTATTSAGTRYSRVEWPDRVLVAEQTDYFGPSVTAGNNALAAGPAPAASQSTITVGQELAVNVSLTFTPELTRLRLRPTRLVSESWQ